MKTQIVTSPHMTEEPIRWGGIDFTTDSEQLEEVTFNRKCGDNGFIITVLASSTIINWKKPSQTTKKKITKLRNLGVGANH